MRVVLIGGSRLNKIKKPLEDIGVECILLKSFFELFKKFDPPIDAIITDTPGIGILKGLILKITNNAPLIYRMRGNYWQEVETEGKLAKLRLLIANNILFRLCDGVVVVNKYLKKEYWRRIRCEERVVVVGLPIDIGRFSSTIRTKSEEFSIITLTNFDYWDKIKTIVDYIDVIDGFLKDVKGKWYIAGKGKYLNRFLEIIKEYQTVEYCGFVKPEEILKRCDVMVHLSEFEGLPNAVLEGMSAGLPVIVNDYEPLKEIEHVIVVRNKKDLLDWLWKLYDNIGLRKRFQRIGIKSSLNTYKNYVKNICKIISLVNSKKLIYGSRKC